jgi:hypothetical protein
LKAFIPSLKTLVVTIDNLNRLPFHIYSMLVGKRFAPI